jgi:SNF family Na+-dependent transporter
VDKNAPLSELTRMYWPLFGVFLISWALVYLIIKNGTDATGKIAMYTVILPYFLLTVLFIRVLTLEGSQIGFRYLLIPDF